MSGLIRVILGEKKGRREGKKEQGKKQFTQLSFPSSTSAYHSVEAREGWREGGCLSLGFIAVKRHHDSLIKTTI